MRTLLIAVLVAVVCVSRPLQASEGAPTAEAFLQAVRDGDKAVVTVGLDAHPEWVHQVMGPWDCPPIHYAADAGRVDIVGLLIERGADVNAHHERYRWYPIHEAAAQGHPEVIALLLDHGADINPANRDDLTPLMMAAGEGHLDAAVLLIRRGAPIDQKDADGWTLLHQASARGDAAMAELLLDRGLAVDVRCSDGRTPLHWAATPALARFLIGRGAAVDARGSHQRTPLHLAAMFGFDEVVAALLDAGAAVNAADADGRTPLDLAGDEGRTATAALLAARGGAAGKAPRVPAPPTRTRIGPKGQFYLNDKPIIPIGVWQQPERLFAYNRALGMTCLVYPPGGGLTDDTSTPAYVRGADEAGLGAFMHYHDSLRALPGTWGWVGGGWPVERARWKYEQLRRKGPGRAILCNFGGHGLVNDDPRETAFYREVFPYIDCLCPHVWPEMNDGEPRNLRNVARMVDTARRLCEGRPGGEVSIWIDINPHAWTNHNREHLAAPTFEEFRYQVWLGLIHGADGICVFPISFNPFVFSQIPAGTEEKLPGLFAQVESLAAVLAAEESPRALRVIGEGTVDVTTRRLDGADYVFAVAGEGEAQTIRLEAEGLGETLALDDVLDQAPRPAAGGSWSERVAPLDLRVWRLTPR
ncbi:MAG: ankyrin repeat domain-containing protein [Planctomycetes bacterium]|nr:ankyrin repeat domain-containing protein [Planctomycetota bacterium]